MVGKVLRGRRRDDSRAMVRSHDKAGMSDRVWRYPAPIWTLMMWLAAGLFSIGLSLFFPENSFLYSNVTIVVAVSLFMLLVTLLVFGGSTPEAVLIGICIVTTLSCSALVINSTTMVGAQTSALGYLGTCMYAAYWFSRRIVVLFAVFTSMAYLLALTLAGDGYIPELFVPWLFTSVLILGASIVLSRLVESMQMKAVVDPLTGLLNRIGFETYLNTASRRAQSPRQLVLVDLDGFKQINDKQGHAAGDEILRELGYAWRRALRTNDVAVRSGGDEFVIVLPQTTEKIAVKIVERLKEVSPIGFSVGIVEWPQNMSFDAASLKADRILYSDKAMRKATAAGRGTNPQVF